MSHVDETGRFDLSQSGENKIAVDVGLDDIDGALELRCQKKTIQVKSLEQAASHENKDQLAATVDRFAR